MYSAVIDLGTNTFNLVIYTIRDNTISVVHRSKQLALLGIGGINQNTISEEAFNRGVGCVEELCATIIEYNASPVQAFATSAIRSASNGNDFVDTIKSRCNIEVNVISGDQEAEYICYGVRKAIELTDNKVLILDIGGGSNELIIANKNKIFWKQSFPLGVSRLLEKFKPSDPFTKEEIDNIYSYLQKELTPLFQEAKNHSLDTLVGASGSFDTFAEIIAIKNGKYETFENSKNFGIELDDYLALHCTLLDSTCKQKSKIKGMNPMRIEMIGFATIITQLIMNELKLNKLIQSEFALREGVLSMLTDHKYDVNF